MFSKKCSNCGERIKKEFSFCPYCSNPATNEREDYGLLGKNDSIKMPLGFNTIFSMLVKQLDKQFRNLEKEISKDYPPDAGITISIAAGGFPHPFKINKQAEKKINAKKTIDEEFIKKLTSLPKKEADGTIKRFGDKIFYEISLPGVSSLKDIILTKLEKSLELKAASDKFIFTKSIPISLPVTRYSLNKEKFTIEFQENYPSFQ